MGSFVGVSIAVFEGCNYNREKEKARILLIQEAMDKKAKALAREQFKREKALREAAAEAREKEEKLKREREKWFWQR